MRLETQGIRIARSHRVILDGIDIVVGGREFVGLVGPNGAGKSTLLRVVTGLEPSDAGTVQFDGRDLTAIGRAELGRRLSYLPQNGRVHWPLSVERVVMLGRLPHLQRFGGAHSHDERAVGRAMTAAGIAALRRRPFATLSGGERMRVLLARALAVEAEILLADEPIAALDPYHQLHIMELLRETACNGTTVVAVLHDLTLAARFCDRLILMADGRVAGDGPPEAVLDEDTIRKTYHVASHRGRIGEDSFFLPWTRLETEHDGI